MAGPVLSLDTGNKYFSDVILDMEEAILVYISAFCAIAQYPFFVNHVPVAFQNNWTGQKGGEDWHI